MKALLIEDNINHLNEIEEIIKDIAVCERAYDGNEGIYMAESCAYDFIIMDMMLPKVSGVDVLKRIREKSIYPIIVLSAVDNADKCVEMLNLGADEYIVMPCDNKEILARIKAVIRRYNNNFYDIYEHDNVSLDYKNQMFFVNGKYLKLAGKVYDVLEYLIRNRNIVIPKEQLFNRVWGTDSDTIITVTEVYVCKLRNALKKYGVDKYLRTVKNVGYMWEDKPID